MKKILIAALAALSLAATLDAKDTRKKDGLGLDIHFLTSTEYGKSPLVGISYPDALGEQTQFMETWTKNTHHFGVELLRFNFPAGDYAQLFTGIRMDRYEYFFRNRYTFAYSGGNVFPVDLTQETYPHYKSSELRTTYWSIPLGFNLKLNKKWSAEAYAFAGLLGKSVNIVRSPKDKTYNPGGLNNFQYGIGAAIMRRHLGVSVKYIPSSVFKEGVGPDTNTLSFGIILH